MTYFLTSSPVDENGRLNPANGFAAELKRRLPARLRGLFVASSPDDEAACQRFSQNLRAILEDAGFAFDTCQILDRKTADQAANMVAEANLILLAGGHVPTQNRFFAEIGLKDLLRAFGGILIGISAGTMNAAQLVYAHPELEGEAVSKTYRRFLPGLGLTQTMILPHYNLIRHDVLDGLRVFEDIAYPDSMGRCFYALPDGSYLFGCGGREELRGEAYRIADGQLKKVCQTGGILPL